MIGKEWKRQKGDTAAPVKSRNSDSKSSHNSCGGCNACHQMTRIHSATGSPTWDGTGDGGQEPKLQRPCVTNLLQRNLGNSYMQSIAGNQAPFGQASPRSGIPAIQRKCACGGTAGLDGECSECREKQLIGLTPLVQTKLRTGQPGDKYEQESDHVADMVMRMPEPSVQRQNDLDEEQEEEIVQTKPVSAQITTVIQRQVELEEEEEPIPEEEEEEEFFQAKPVPGQSPEVTPDLVARIQSLRGGGQPLPESTRRFFEARFGHDFSNVRAHNDELSSKSAKSLNAKAYTVGSDIVFGLGQYDPANSDGKKLLAHELTHVVQQGGTEPVAMGHASSLPIICTDGAFERQADYTDRQVMATSSPGSFPAYFPSERRRSGQGAGSAMWVQRQEEERLPPGKYVGLPNLVTQFDPMACWAAAAEAWLPLVPGRERLDQDQLVGRFANNLNTGALEPYCDSTHPEMPCFAKFASAMGIEYDDVHVGQVGPTFLIRRLMKGPVMVIFNVVAGGASHAVVVYGVGYPDGKELMISFMDPGDGNYHNLGVFEFQRLLAGPRATHRIRRPRWLLPPTRRHPGGIAAVARVAWPGPPPS